MRTQAIKNVEKDFLEPSFNYLVENGLENTSVRDLCKAMNISSGNIYYWFEDKDDIYISTVKYGIGKVVNKLFTALFEKINTPKVFFDTFLDEIDKYKKELRLVFQVTTSPTYGDRMRKKAEEFKPVYSQYINQLSEILKCEPEAIAPVIFFLISILVDYVVWEDREVSKLQIDTIYMVMINYTGKIQE